MATRTQPVKDEEIGLCGDCRSTVVFIDDGICGWRFCLGCMRRGPEVMLTSEVSLALEEIYMVVENESSDDTIAKVPSPEILNLARRP